MTTLRLPSQRRPSFARSVAAHAKSKSKQDIYIGNGQYVKDDPSKYPSKDSWSGGWAGGETGLSQFLEDNKAGQGKPVRRGPATKLLGGRDVIYTGKGNYVRDDATKYPSKTSMTGGFAGGERGVKKFVDEGDLSFEKEFRPQSSPLIVGLAMSGVAIIISSLWFAIEN